MRTVMSLWYRPGLVIRIVKRLQQCITTRKNSACNKKLEQTKNHQMLMLMLLWMQTRTCNCSCQHTAAFNILQLSTYWSYQHITGVKILQLSTHYTCKPVIVVSNLPLSIRSTSAIWQLIKGVKEVNWDKEDLEEWWVGEDGKRWELWKGVTNEVKRYWLGQVKRGRNERWWVWWMR